jgi:hypothetical protein
LYNECIILCVEQQRGAGGESGGANRWRQAQRSFPNYRVTCRHDRVLFT